MGKAPADQFYWQDWARDLEEHPLKIEGAWIRICCKLWWSETRGEITKSPMQWGRILRVSKLTAMGIIKYIKKEKIGDVTFCNPNVTVRCRRMWREEKKRQANRDKVARHRRKMKLNGDAESNQEITPSSSSSSSSSLEDTLKKESDQGQAFSLLQQEDLENASIPMLKKHLDSLAEEIYQKGLFPKVHAFKNKMLKEKKNPRSIIHALNRLYIKNIPPEKAWPYCMKIIQIEDGNYNERDYRKSD